MDGVPALWNASGFGHKEAHKATPEFLVYLIGVVELQAEGSDDTFTPLGEDAFNEVMTKKLMARRKKTVKNEMVNSLMDEQNTMSTR